jgi:hypothetical protein
MADDDRSSGSDTLEVPFVFVKHGDPEPTEWMARHPGWVKFPATMVPRSRIGSGHEPFGKGTVTRLGDRPGFHAEFDRHTCVGRSTTLGRSSGI